MILAPSASSVTVFGVEAKGLAFCYEAGPCGYHVHRQLPNLERFPIRWNHLIEKESLSFKELEHVKLEKVEQLFKNMLLAIDATWWRRR